MESQLSIVVLLVRVVSARPSEPSSSCRYMYASTCFLHCHAVKWLQAVRVVVVRCGFGLHISTYIPPNLSSSYAHAPSQRYLTENCPAQHQCMPAVVSSGHWSQRSHASPPIVQNRLLNLDDPPQKRLEHLSLVTASSEDRASVSIIRRRVPCQALGTIYLHISAFGSSLPPTGSIRFFPKPLQLLLAVYVKERVAEHRKDESDG